MTQRVIGASSSKEIRTQKLRDTSRIIPGCEVKLVEVDPITGKRKRGEKPFFYTAGYGSTALAANICDRTSGDRAKGSGIKEYEILSFTPPEISSGSAAFSTANMPDSPAS